MDKDTASALLGLSDDRTPATIESAFSQRRDAAQQRLATAPTESLRQKYTQALQELDQARQVLLSAQVAAAGGLSRTKMADLPGAQPLYTRLGSGGDGAAREAQQLQPGEVMAGRYEIRACIGLGGMGAVYRAFDRNRREEIALKVLLPHLLAHPQARERLVAEAKIASSLSHPNIVNVFDLQREADQDFLTMELLQGQTLRSLMQARKAARKPFTPAEAADIAQAIAGALDYAHKRTVHRDLKPENVWVEDDGTVKLMDFGIARAMTNSQLTQTTTAMGTAYYMAPEQLRGAKEVDGRADQYALGVLVYELLSGDIPAGRIRSLHLVNKAVPKGMSAAIDRALDPQREQRFATAGEFVQAMRKRHVLPGVLRWPVLVPVALVVALGVGAAAFWPQIRALLPDAEQTRAQREAAIQAQAIVETQLKQMEGVERELDQRVRDAKGNVDRYENAVRSARSDAERQEPARQLEAARAQLAVETEVRDTTQKLVFRSDALARLRGQLKLGEDALKERNVAQAAQVLTQAREAAEAMAKVPAQVREIVSARSDFNGTVARIEKLAKEEKQDVAAVLAALRQASDAARMAADGGKLAQAVGAWNEAKVGATKTLNDLADKVIAGYVQLVDKAKQAERLDLAQAALDGAKRVQGYKR